MKSLVSFIFFSGVLFSTEAAYGKTIEYAYVPDQKIHVLTTDIKSLQSLCVSKAAGDLCAREELSSMASRHSPSVGINLGSFRRGGRFDGCPQGLLIMDSYPYSDPGFNRPTLVIDAVKRTLALSRTKIVWAVTVHDQIVPLDKINQPAAANEVVAYNAFFGGETKTTCEGIELVVDRGQLVQVRNFWGSGSIPRQGYVVRIGAKHPLAAVDWKSCLAKPCSASIKTTMLDLERDAIFAIQGLVMLVEDGKIVENFSQQLVAGGLSAPLADEITIDLQQETALADFINKPNAHTALGITNDGLLKIVVIEGGDASDVSGVDLGTLAQLMQALGCVQAMLAGSGADVGLWLRTRMITTPGGNDQLPGRCEERPIATALMLFEE